MNASDSLRVKGSHALLLQETSACHFKETHTREKLKPDSSQFQRNTARSSREHDILTMVWHIMTLFFDVRRPLGGFSSINDTKHGSLHEWGRRMSATSLLEPFGNLEITCFERFESHWTNMTKLYIDFIKLWSKHVEPYWAAYLIHADTTSTLRFFQGISLSQG